MAQRGSRQAEPAAGTTRTSPVGRAKVGARRAKVDGARAGTFRPALAGERSPARPSPARGPGTERVVDAKGAGPAAAPRMPAWEFGTLPIEAKPAFPAPHVAVPGQRSASAPPTAAPATLPPSSLTIPSRPVGARDPATLVESARRQDTPAELPLLTELARRLNVSLGAIEVYVGTGARRACDALGARALAAHNVILFADRSPTFTTIAHELAHVIQQRAHRAGGGVRTFEPGALSVADAASYAERQADAFAAGSLRLADLATAPFAIYLKSIPEGLDLDEADLKIVERRFKRFLKKKSNFSISDRGDKPVFCRVKKDGKTSGEYSQSSKETFQYQDYAEQFGKVDDDERPVDPEQKPQEADLADIFESFAERWRLSKVGSSGEKARKYAVTGDEAYRSVIFEIADEVRKEPTPQENAVTVDKYEAAIASIKRMGKWQWKKATFRDRRAVTAQELSDARDEMEERIVNAYTTRGIGITELYKEVIEPAIFAPPYTRIQGNIFEEWVKQKRPGVVKTAGQVTFANEEVDRLADLVVKDKERGRILGEAKGVAGAPGKREKEQMADYRRIIVEKIPGFYTLDDEKVEDVVFKFVRYYFPNKDVARLWMPALLGVFKTKADLERFDTNPVVDKVRPGKTVKSRVKANPIIEVTIDHADDLANLTHRVPNPTVRVPGLKLSFYEVTLEAAGFPAIVSGRMGVELDTKGAPISTEGPTEKVITPTPSTPAVGADGAPQPDVQALTGSIENGFEKAKVGGLDKFLQRVRVDARLTDDGIAATISVAPGPSGIARISFDKAATLTAAYTAKGFTVDGEVSLVYTDDPQKLSGSVKASYKNGEWIIEGAATVGKLVEGLDPFTVKVHYSSKDDVTTVGADKLKVKRATKGVTLTGEILKLSYNVTKGGFSADNVNLIADLGPFGTAKAAAKIDDDKITKATFAYDSPLLRYPRKSPVLEGKIGGEVTYDQGKFSGKITGTANLKVPALDKIAKGLSDLGLTVAAQLNPDGTYEGTIAAAKPIQLGKHFKVPQITATLGPDGSISSEFTVSIVDLSILKQGQIHCTLGPDRLQIDVEGKGSFGDPEKGKYWGEAALKYQSADQAFIVSGTLNYKIKEGMVASGTITYNSATHKADTHLTIGRIQLLQLKKQNTLLDLNKQIELISFYKIIGIYLDLGFGLIFNLDFDLAVEPTLELKELDLVAFTFKEIDGQMKLTGGLRATLTATPHIGLGFFALSPKILRAGGGLEFPIVAEAKLTPNAVIRIQYTPEGGVKGAAKAALTLTFGITGSVRPYAEFSVLDGLYDASWKGDALASFTILPERELFTHVIDFGGSLEKDENPKLPTGAQAPRSFGSDTQVVPQAKQEPKATAVDTTKKDPPSDAAGDKAKDEKGFSIGGLIDGLKSGASYQKVSALLDVVGDVWGALEKLWEFVVKFFRNWYDRIKQFLDDVVGFLKRLGKEGLVATIKWVLLKVLGQDIYDIIVPVLDALQATEEHFRGLLEKPLPTTFTGFLGWMIDVVTEIIGIGFGTIIDLGKAVVEVARRAAAAAGRFVNGLVQQGKIGVQRTPRYVGSETLGLAHYFMSADRYKIHLAGIDAEHDNSNDTILLPKASAAVAYGLWFALDAIPQVKVTSTRVDSDAGAYDDYWV